MLGPAASAVDLICRCRSSDGRLACCQADAVDAPLNFELRRPAWFRFPSRGRRARSQLRRFADARRRCRRRESPTAERRGGRRPTGRTPRQRRTRIKPPGDIIKLADRLHYVLAAVAGIAAGRRLAGVSLPPVPVPVRGHRVSLSAPGGDPGRRDGAGQDDAGHHGHPPAAAPRRGAKRAAGLPQAAGDQLAARVRRLGAGSAGDGHRRRSGQTPAGSGRCPTSRCESPTTNCCCATANCWPTSISIWSCSTNRSGSRTAPARPARSSARSRANAIGP